MRFRNLGRVCLSLGLLACLTLLQFQVPAFAQNVNGRIIVNVKDENTAVVAGAAIKVVNEGTLIEESGVTNEEGVYIVPQAQFGTYTITIEAQGFKTKIVQGVKVDAGQDYSLIEALETGGIGETVTVVAGEDLVPSTSTEISATVSQRQVQDLPLDGRSPLSLVNLQAGTNANGRTNTAINGQRVSSVDVRQDGLNIQDNFIRAGGFEVTATRPTVAATAEFTVTTSNSGVDSSGASSVRLVTPSGTSELHGEVFEYHRNDFFGANDFFNNEAEPEIERPHLIRNQFGFRVGGPVYVPKVFEQKEKVFFFGFYEGQRQREGLPTDTLTFTDTARNGIFRYVDQNTGQIRSVNVLQLGGFQADPITQGILAQLPTTINQPDLGDGLNTGGYSFNKASFWDRNQGGVRIDWSITPKHSLEAVYNYTGEVVSREDIDTTFRVNPVAVNKQQAHFGVLAWNWTISDRFVNEVRGGTVNSTVPFLLLEDRGVPFLVTLPLVTDPVADLGQVTPQGRRTITSSFIDNATYLWGNHFFQFGGEVQDIRVRSYSSFGLIPSLTLGFGTAAPGGSDLEFADFPAGSISSADLATANAILAAQAGVFSGASRGFEATSQDSGFVAGAQNVRNFIVRNYSLYVADQWKVNPRVTLNLGLRWEYLTPLRERDDLALQPIFNGIDAKSTVLDPDGRVDFVRGFYNNPDKNNIAPELGVAWDVFGTGKTVVRGGYTMKFVNDEVIRAADNAAVGNDGLSSSVAFTNLFGTLGGTSFEGNPTTSAQTIIATQLVAPEYAVPRSYLDNFNLDPTSAAFLVDPNLATPFYHQWNFSIEHELGWDTAVSARYVGNRSRNLVRGVDYNQVDVINNGFAADVLRAQANGFLALAATGTFNPGYTGPGSVPLQVFPNLASGGLLGNGTIRGLIQTGEAGTLAQVYFTNGLQGDVQFTANPNTFVADVLGNFGRSDYHALQLEVRRRFSSSLGFQANYTWSKTLTDSSGTSQQKFEPPLDINNLSIERSRAVYDIPHAFKANVLYELPFGEGKRWADFDNGIAKRAVSGWELTSIVNWQSGAPFSIVSARGTFNRVGRSPLNTVDSTLSNDQIQDLIGIYRTPEGLFWIDPAVLNTDGRGANVAGQSAFAGQVFFNPNAGSVGSLQRYAFNNPAIITWDFGVIKRTPITETVGVEFRAEFFNFLNHPEFFIGDRNVNSVTFGQITQTITAPRVVQLAAKVTF